MKRTELIEVASKLYNNAMSLETQLNYCTAWYKTVTTKNGSYEILKSYSTIVALCSYRTGTLYVFDYYSATTSQHISKFIKYIAPSRIVYLYDRSDRVLEYNRITHEHWKTTKIVRRQIKALDYDTYIETIEL